MIDRFDRRWIFAFVIILSAGCTQAFVEVRHDRSSRLDHPPDTTLSIGARWYFWDSYADWLAKKLKEGIP